MPVDKPQHTALTPIPTTAESSSAQGVGKPSFHQQLRDHIRAAVQVVREAIMRDELTQLVGAHWAESTSASLGYRNGSYRRESFDHLGSDPGPASAPRPGRQVSHPARGIALVGTKSKWQRA